MYDVAVIGGGVNGCGIARDAAGRGLKVLLVEQGDLASGTSSASTKLVHGGLRYLEQYEFRLVRELLLEREVLWTMAPHIVKPMRFVLPHHKGLRPAWLIRLGLFLYDHIGGRRRLPPCRSIDLQHDAAGKPLQPQYVKGFEYSDCWVDDARLVVLNAMDAAARGADIRVRTELTGATCEDGCWHLNLADRRGGGESRAEARVLVNAAGPWVAEVLNRCLNSSRQARIRLVRGSHIVVPRLFEHERAYIFQNADRRIVFAIPYEHDFTLIGTTDVDVGDDPRAARISAAEIDYLCRAVNEYFANPVSPDDVVWSYAGIRPLYDDGSSDAQQATRDYVLELTKLDGGAAKINVFGGKITTYRRLAAEVMERLSPVLPSMGAAWTRGAALPGGDFAIEALENEIVALQARCPVLTTDHARRLVRAYGTRAGEIVAEVKTAADLGAHFGADLYECEAAYLVRHEWAMTPEDILWRRSKLGLRVGPEDVKRLAAWLDRHCPEATAPAPAT